jgi:hypothetical protein
MRGPSERAGTRGNEGRRLSCPRRQCKACSWADGPLVEVPMRRAFQHAVARWRAHLASDSMELRPGSRVEDRLRPNTVRGWRRGPRRAENCLNHPDFFQQPQPTGELRRLRWLVFHQREPPLIRSSGVKIRPYVECVARLFKLVKAYIHDVPETAASVCYPARCIHVYACGIKRFMDLCQRTELVIAL